jgi:hypothetical protein
VITNGEGILGLDGYIIFAADIVNPKGIILARLCTYIEEKNNNRAISKSIRKIGYS